MKTRLLSLIGLYAACMLINPAFGQSGRQDASTSTMFALPIAVETRIEMAQERARKKDSGQSADVGASLDRAAAAAAADAAAADAASTRNALAARRSKIEREKTAALQSRVGTCEIKPVMTKADMEKCR